MAFDPQARRWQVVRLTLGFVQMGGAVFAVTLIVFTGISPWSLAAVVITCVLTSISVLLFGARQRLR